MLLHVHTKYHLANAYIFTLFIDDCGIAHQIHVVNPLLIVCLTWPEIFESYHKLDCLPDCLSINPLCYLPFEINFHQKLFQNLLRIYR